MHLSGRDHQRLVQRRCPPSLTWVSGELERTKPALPSSGGETLFLVSTSSAKPVGTSEAFVPPRGGTCPQGVPFIQLQASI